MDHNDELNEMRQRLKDMEKALAEAQEATERTVTLQPIPDQTVSGQTEHIPPPAAGYGPPPYMQIPPKYQPKYPLPPQYSPQQYHPQQYPPQQYPPHPQPTPQTPPPGSGYREPNYQYHQTGYRQYASYPKTKSKWTEAVIGKYLVGIIAALLVFAAAISFIILLWENIMTDLAIFIIVLLAGLIILTTGFIRLQKHKNAITSILVGTGAGLIFIALGAGHIAFYLFDEIAAIGLILIWSAGLLLSFRYSRLFFTSVIAYCGGLIALMFFYSRAVTAADLVTALIFMFIVLGVFLLSTSLWMNKLKQYIAGLMALALPFSFIAAFTHTFILRPVYIHFWCLVVCCALLYFIYFYIRRAMQDDLHGVKSIALETAVLITAYSLMITFLPDWGPVLPGLSPLIRSAIVTVVMGVALLFMYKQSIVALLMFMLSAVVTVSQIDGVSYGPVLLGILTFAAYFLKDARFNGKKFVTLCLTYCCFMGVILLGPYNAYEESLINNLIFILGTIGTVAVSFCLVYNYYKKDENTAMIINAKISAFVIAAVLIPILATLAVSYRYDGRPYSLSETVFLAVMTVICVAFYYSGYFLDWRKEGAFPYSNREIKRYSFDISGILAFSFIFVLYAACLFIILGSSIPWYLRLINTGSALCILGLQTYILFGRYKAVPFAAVATGSIWLIFGWVFLYGWFNAGINTLEASILGMALAFVSIFIGVMLRISIYRIFGLIITLCMTVKAILLDFVYTDGVTRVVALLIGGIICFGISIVYSRLESSLKQSQGTEETAYDPEESVDTVETHNVVINEESQNTIVE